ncbi:IclR family transcriptional regulator [Roseovarius indicus]|uniref:IclR family transcriptional regulator n=1 Tax=Roseovarius indicus TaxID=540747 RepID=UPI0007DA02E9|nr:IclR family transcriptional regulator [Roseovarius indicus]OAN98504.1 hypothetical protein A8B76_00155 [Roseovarius indicus]
MDEETPVTKGDEQKDDKVDERYIVPGLARGLAILHLFSRENPELTLSELADGLGLSRSAAYRLVFTLDHLGYIARNPSNRRFHLTSKVLTLGHQYLETQPLDQVARPYLLRISETTKSASHLVVLEDWQSVYIARSAPPVALIANLQIGTRLPAHMTASGRVLLSHKSRNDLHALWTRMHENHSGAGADMTFEDLMKQADEDRSRGYVFGRSHFNLGTISFAAPVFDRPNNVVAAINVVATQELMDQFGGETKMKDVVLPAVQDLSRELGYSPA